MQWPACRFVCVCVQNKREEKRAKPQLMALVSGGGERGRRSSCLQFFFVRKVSSRNGDWWIVSKLLLLNFSHYLQLEQIWICTVLHVYVRAYFDVFTWSVQKLHNLLLFFSSAFLFLLTQLCSFVRHATSHMHTFFYCILFSVKSNEIHKQYKCAACVERWLICVHQPQLENFFHQHIFARASAWWVRERGR